MTFVQEDISAQNFWKLYFTNCLATAERSEESIRGQYKGDASKAGFFREFELRNYSVSLESLREYDYLQDPRFVQFTKYPVRMDDALRRIQNFQYPFFEHPPFGSARMGELAAMLNQDSFRQMLSMNASAELIELVNQKIAAGDGDIHSQCLDVLIWVSGETRATSHAQSLCGLLSKNLAFPASDNRRLSASRINLVFEALSKINAKNCATILVEVMRNSESSLRLKAAAVLKRMYSHERLLSKEELRDEYDLPKFWEDIVNRHQSLSPTEQEVFDLTGFYWDLRFVAVKRATISEAVQKAAENDLVAQVRNEAKAKAKSLQRQ